MKETKAPGGYIQNNDTITLTFSASGAQIQRGWTQFQVMTTRKRGNLYPWSEGYAESTSKETVVYIVSVTNSGGLELPETGGLGANEYTWAGAVLTSAACVLMYIYYKQRKEVVRRE